MTRCVSPITHAPLSAYGCVGCYEMVPYMGGNIFDTAGQAFKDAAYKVGDFAAAVANRGVQITEKTFESVAELAKKGVKFFVGMTKAFADKVVQGWNWLSGQLKKAFRATVDALKKMMLWVKKTFFEGIVKLARSKGRLAGMPETDPSLGGFAGGVDLSLKSLGCAFEKHLKVPAVKAELVAECLAAIVGGIYSGGTAALAAAGAMVGRHGSAVMVKAAEEGCRDVKNPVDPNNPTGGKGLSPYVVAGLGFGGVLLAMYLASDEEPGKGKHNGNSRRARVGKRNNAPSLVR